MNNYVAFFRYVERASYLQACLMHQHFYGVRANAFRTMHVAYRYVRFINEAAALRVGRHLEHSIC